jgi:hypothetical protein
VASIEVAQQALEQLQQELKKRFDAVPIAMKTHGEKCYRCFFRCCPNVEARTSACRPQHLCVDSLDLDAMFHCFALKSRISFLLADETSADEASADEASADSAQIPDVIKNMAVNVATSITQSRYAYHSCTLSQMFRQTEQEDKVYARL